MSEICGMAARERAVLWDRLRPGRAIDDAELTALVVWSVLAEPGDGLAGRLVTELGAAEALQLVARGAEVTGESAVREAASVAARAIVAAYRDRGLDAPTGLRAGFLRWQPRMTSPLIDNAFDMAAASDTELLVPADPQWSSGFADLGEHAPLLLWCLGRPELLADPAHTAAMVGTRAATGYGTHVAAEFASGLVGHEWTVASGGAYGIDATAHRSALAAHGRTVAVMAGGLNSFYPAGNAELLARVAREGLVIAEVPFGTPPTAFRFLSRNRLIAALSGTTVVVEAGLRSGSLNTANHAGSLGRAIGVVPGPITSPSAAGCYRVLKDHPAHIVTSVAEIMALTQGTAAAPEPLADDGDPRFGRIRAALSTRSARSVADVAIRSGFGEGETAGLLGVLLLDGVVRKTEAGWVSVTPKR